MKHLKKFESYFTKDIDVLPPPPIDIDDNNGGDDGEDSQIFKYDFRVYNLRFDILTDDDISKEVESLNWDSNKVVINKYAIDGGYVCFKVDNFFKSGNSQYLMLDAYYATDNTNNGRLNTKEFIVEISRIIYEKVEYPFEIITKSLYYDSWNKAAWLELK